MKNFFFTIIFFCFSPFVLGQVDTILELKEVLLLEPKTNIRPLNHQVGSQFQVWQPPQLKNLPAVTIADLLSTESNVFIKNYGNGSLSTSSVRGGNASHTLVLWNGMPLQSPMLGLLDLSLLPVTSAEEIVFSRGGNSAVWGSGAIGGVVSLNNVADFNNKKSFEAMTEVGSFGAFTQNFKANVGSKNFKSVTKFGFREAKNNFNYEINPDLPERKQTHAEFFQRNFLQDFYWKINPQNQVNIHFWRQFSDRNIPPTTTQNNSEAYQIDESTRTIAEWKYQKNNIGFQTKIGYFNEHLDYFDPPTRTESISVFNTIMGDINMSHNWNNNHILDVGVTHFFTEIKASVYSQKPQENRTALWLNYQFRAQKWQFQASLRQEMVDSGLIPLVPVVGLDYDAFSFLKIKTKVSKNYRLPTFNDRYWKPGGNPNLLPESGWSEEISLVFNTPKPKTTYSITAFNRNIDNRILWSSTDGQPFWSANNVTEVWSRGVEQKMTSNFKIGGLVIKNVVGYDFIRSTNQVALQNPNLPKGEQLIYTPIHQGFFKAVFQFKNYSATYQHHFTGKSRGVNDEVAAYDVANIRFQYDFDKNKWGGTAFFNINNVWGKNYVIVERRPMPKINFIAGLRVRFSGE